MLELLCRYTLIYEPNYIILVKEKKTNHSTQNKKIGVKKY